LCIANCSIFIARNFSLSSSTLTKEKKRLIELFSLSIGLIGSQIQIWNYQRAVGPWPLGLKENAMAFTMTLPFPL
jgi:hypothetical protein